MKTLVIGASTNPERYAFTAIHKLLEKGHEVMALGLKKGVVAGIEIQTGKPDFKGVDTVTLYVGPKHQPEFYDYIISLHPRRVIFNPGTENPEFEEKLKKNNIEPEVACTLVLLGAGTF